MEPKWLSLRMARAMHTEAVAVFGGSPEMRDEGLFESALQRPRNLYAYGENPSLFGLAAAHCRGIVKNHPFVDGNKRAGVLAATAFLDLNGYDFRPTEADAATIIMALAAGEIEEDILVRWFSDYSTPAPR